MPFTVNPRSTTGQEQQNTNTEDVDLGQSQYNFNYLVFPNDLGMDDNGHYMIININVPTKTTSATTPAGQYTNQFTLTPEFKKSKVDELRFGQGVVNTGVNSRNNGDRSLFSIPRRTRRIAQSIALHMPTPLVFNTHNAYEEISLTALGAKLGVGGVAGAVSFLGAAAGGILAPAIAAAANFRKISSPAGQVIMGASKVLQTPINPAVEILFANTIARNFTLEVLMAPRNEQESINMKSIIKTMRFHGAPEINDIFSLFWIPPAEFDITFFNKGVENMNILRINTCVLERIEVDYAPTGVYSTFRNGHPVAARLSMGFREIEPLHKKRILQGF
jgi:hypothetical protein